MERPLFSERAGRSAPPSLDLRGLQIAFEAVYTRHSRDGYFLKAYTKDCPDNAAVGDFAMSLEDAVVVRFGEARNLRLTERGIRVMSADDIFDLIEFLHDAAALPVKTRNHKFNGCGMHVVDAVYPAGRNDWREATNAYLSKLDPPHRLTENGEVQLLPSEPGLLALVDDRLESGDAENIDGRVDRAVAKFFARHATVDEQREAIRILADVLEFLTKDISKHLTNKDNSDLFNIANNYAIRHHNGKQVTGYDPAFYPWIFHVYLATINLVVRLRGRA